MIQSTTWNGANQTVALKSDGMVWDWGNNVLDQLGVRNNCNNRLNPVQTVVSGGIGALNTATGTTVKAGISYIGTISAG